MKMKEKKQLLSGLFILLFFAGSGAKVVTITISELSAAGISLSMIGVSGAAYVMAVFLSGLFFSNVLKHISVDKVMKVGGIMMAAGYAVLGFSIRSQVCMLLGMILIGMAATFVGYSPVSVIIRRYFTSGKLLTAIIFSGTAIGASCYSALYGVGIPWIGFQKTLLLFSVAQVLAVMLVSIFLMRRKLEENSNEKEQERSEGGKKKSSHLRLPVFWYIFFFAVLASGVVSTAHAYLPAYLVERGFSLSISSGMYSVMMLAAAPASILSGYLSEKYSTDVFINSNMGALVVGMVLLLFAPGEKLLWVAAILLGIACPVSTLAGPLMLGEVFDHRTFTKSIGIVNASAFVCLGTMFCAVAVFTEIVGTYQIAFRILLILSFLLGAAGTAWRYMKKRGRRK